MSINQLLNRTEEQKAEARAKARAAQALKDPKTLVLAPDFLSAGAQTSKIQAWLASVPVRYRNALFSIFSGTASPSTERRMKCITCVNFEDAINAVGQCKAFLCPLWRNRPYQKGTDEEE